MSAQADFAAALLQPERVPEGLFASNGSPVQRRVDVHRNNVIAGLIDLLGESFPVVRRLVGDDFFAAMAAAFVREAPPRSPLLFEYGAGLPSWLASFAPAASLPYLADMARLEWLQQQAAHAADAERPSLQQLASALADPAALPTLVARLHPSLAVLRARCGVVSLWRAHQHDDEAAIAAVDWRRAESALVLRDSDDEVCVVALEDADAAFIESLGTGTPLGDALAGAGEGFDASRALGLLLRHGALLHWQRAAASTDLETRA